MIIRHIMQIAPSSLLWTNDGVVKKHIIIWMRFIAMVIISLERRGIIFEADDGTMQIPDPKN